MELAHLRYLTLSGIASSGHRHLSAASGIVALGSHLCIIGDDECGLAIFPAEGEAPGRMAQLLPEGLPRDPLLRKATKPDFEVLLSLSADRWSSTILALGSGSTDQRRRAAVVQVTNDGEVANVEILDMAPLFAAIAGVVEEVNIEGAATRGGRLFLFNRGNVSRPSNSILAVDLARTLAGDIPEILTRIDLGLPRAGGVPLCITDACGCEDGSIIISAVAEDTADSYNDGEVVGAALGVLDDGLRLVRFEELTTPIKIEGVHAQRSDKGIHVLVVSDPDNPTVAGELFTGLIQD